MKKNILLCIVIFIASTCAINAATKISARSGGFGLASTWEDNIPPASGDHIIILAGHGVHGTGGAVVRNVIVQGSLTLSYPGLVIVGNLQVEKGGILQSLTGTLHFNGTICINEGTISASTHFNGTDTQSISGDGFWKVNLGVFNGGTKELDDLKMIGGTWQVNSRIVIGTRWWMHDGKIVKSATGIIESKTESSLIEFQGVGHFASDETTENLWKTKIVVMTGTRAATSSSSISAFVTVEDGATLSTTLSVTLNLKNDVHIKSGGKLSGQTVRLSGANVFNYGEVFPTVLEFNRVGDQDIGGSGVWRNSNGIYFRGSGTTSLYGDMITTVRTVSVESMLDLKNFNLTLNGGNFNKTATGTIIGTGEVYLTGIGGLYSNETAGNLWSARLKIASETRSAYSSSTISAHVKVEAGAVLSTHLSVTLHLKGDVWIKERGQLSGQTIRLSGATILNDGEVLPTVLEFDSDEEQEIGGGDGLWRSSNGIYFSGRGRKSLVNNMTTSVRSITVEGRLNLNDHNLIINAGNFNKPETGTIIGTGKIVSTGVDGNIYSHETAGNLWYAPLEIASGSRAANSTSSFTGPITVKSGAILSTHLRKIIYANGGLTVEPGASVAGETLVLNNGDFVNDGVVATVRTLFNGSNTLSGTTGRFVNSAYFNPGAAVKLDGVQQFKNLHVETSGAFDISTQTIRISGALIVKGNLKTTASTIEFNSTSAEQSIPTNIDYYNLTINNSRAVNLGAAETVQNHLRLKLGGFYIATNRLTIGSCGQIIYGEGVLYGTPIYLTCS